MSAIKKYNSKTKEWDTIATSNASQISVRSESLLEDGQEESNVESVLQKLNQDISTLKGNVSWLAEHGGGGSGGGGGGTASASILVNNKTTGNNVAVTTEGLIIAVQSSTSLTWSVSVVVGSKVIKSVNNVTTSVTISKSDLNKLGLTKNFSLQITAFNESSLTNIYWNGEVVFQTVELSTIEESNFKFDDIDSAYLTYDYEVGVSGTYTLYINDNVIETKTITDVNRKDSIKVSLEAFKDILNLEVGTNTLKAYFQSATDSTVKSEICESRVILTSDNPIISCSDLSENPENRTPITISGSSYTLALNITTYYTSGSYKVQIYKEGTEPADWNSITQYYSFNTKIALSSKLDNLEVGQDLNIIIAIYTASQVYSKTLYAKTEKATYELLNHGISPIFSYYAFNGIIQNDTFESVLSENPNTVFNIKNANINTVIKSSDQSLRLQNAAYGVINSPTRPFVEYFGSNGLTLSICYKADFHPDDNRTILQYATVNKQMTPSAGIIIRDHVLYIANNTVELQDNELLNITITYLPISSTNNQGNVFVYINGVVESVFQNVSKDDIIPKSSANLYDIYVGTQTDINKEIVSYYTDVNIYRVSLYNTCLNPLQVLYDYLNDLALSHPINTDGINYSPNTDYIKEGLSRNFITNDSEHKSLLYNSSVIFNNNNSDYSDYFSLTQFVVNSEESVGINPNIQNYTIPLPIVSIDVKDSWKWTEFISPGQALSQVVGCHFEYYDQNGTNNGIVKGKCNVSIQGTSTLNNCIKNLNIEFSDGTIFIPKETWFPEQTYTLKADIVDSSHSLNASIGKFVNEELGTNASGEEWYPFSTTVKSSFNAQKNNTSSAINTYFPKATLKHGVEGFPIFLILTFKSEDGLSSETHSMGIYQFILGRESPRNLGYEIITSVTSELNPNNLVYPLLQENVTLGIKYNNGCWIEMGSNETFSEVEKFQELDSISDVALTGLFWQTNDHKITGTDNVDYSADEYYSTMAEIKYATPNTVDTVVNFEPFRNFIKNVIKLPVTNRHYSVTSNKFLVPHTFSNTRYPVYITEEGSSPLKWVKKEGEYNTIISAGDQMIAPLNELNLNCYAKYFVICMFFGLIDNFMKNMPIKFYKDSNGNWEPPLLGIYDTDTAIGGDNEGKLQVSESVWLSTLENDSTNALRETSSSYSDSQRHVIGNKNKLWYFDSPDVNYQLGYDKDNVRTRSLYATQWHSFLNLLQTKYAGTEYAITTPDDVANLYYNKYFIPQTEGCGELLFNLTYFIKYLNTYKINDTSSINQSSNLHGRRQQQVRKWMNNRVKFLDSMYTALGSPSESITPISTCSATFSSGATPLFNLTSNYPIISYVSNQGSDGAFVFLDENVKTNVYWGSQEPVSQKYNHIITYSDAIQTLGDDNLKLKDIYFSEVQTGNLYSITIFDAYGCSALVAQVENALKYFKKNNGVSELREINLANTAKSTYSSKFNYKIDLQEGFSKLQKLNLNNSCATEIVLPSGSNSIPLLEFDIRNSQIRNLTLDNQNLLTTVDLSGCQYLQSITINSCNNLQSLVLDSTLINLTSIEINSDNFAEISCTNNDTLISAYISSTGLTSVNFSKCANLTSLTISGNNLNSLDLSYCDKLTTVNIIGNTKDSIDFINLSDSAVKCIKYNGVGDSNLLDLSCYKAINSFNIASNTAVEYIQFNNDKDNPIIISKAFSTIPTLKRVYGNLQINVSSVFKGCTSFSILGEDMNEYLDGIMVDTSGRIKFFTEVPDAVESNKPKFQEGNKVTNLIFNNTSGSYNFSSTNCTLLDVYYVFYNIGAITDCSNMFNDVKDLSIVSWTKNCDNSFNRNMFINCGNVTNLTQCFYRTPLGLFRVFSPSHTSEGEITADDGLFSPLVNCIHVNRIFGDNDFYGDRLQFRRKEGDYKLEDLKYLNIRLLIDDVNSYPHDPPEDSGSLFTIYESIGNYNGFFNNLPHVTSVYRFSYSARLINWDLTGELLCPAFQYANSFNATYFTGEIDLNKLFKSPGSVTKINSSFCANGGNGSSEVHSQLPKSTFEIKEGMLENFVNLEEWGFTDGTGDSKRDTASFIGSEIERTYGDSIFPYGMFQKNTKLKTAVDFFRDVTGNILISNGLPYNLFENNPNITDVRRLFYNISSDFELTSEGFKNCTNLQNVSQMFAGANSHLKNSSIPQKLFYHGSVKRSKTYTGYNYWNEDQSDYTYDPTEIVYDSAEDEVGHQKGFLNGITETVTVTWDDPYATITDISYCFDSDSINYYSNDNPTVENNPDYLPFTHIIENGVIKKAKYNDYVKTIIWEYDGVTVPTTSEKTENLDEPYSELDSYNDIQYMTDYSIKNTPHFLCAPDLLRYCSKSAAIQGLFNGCGYSSNSSIAYVDTPATNIQEFGIKGRIPPYLLKPVSSITDISYMFNQGSLISSYTTEGETSYLIPKTFFSYAPNIQKMNYTFRGITCPIGIDLNVFSSTFSGKSIDIDHIFYYCYFDGTATKRAKISNVFKNIKITKMERAFSVNNDNSNVSYSNNVRRNQYVEFSDNFTQSYLAKNIDQYVFDGYKESTVLFSSKSLQDRNSNYRTC